MEKFLVMETFGPVMQGEGAMIGKMTHFVRFGGCDFRCSLCDSLKAVDPKSVRKLKTMMSIEEITEACVKLNPKGFFVPWVTLSGGNPCLHQLNELVPSLRSAGFKIAVEAQGTHYKPWLRQCDLVTISPKGPGMYEGTDGEEQPTGPIDEFIQGLTGHVPINIKVVIFGAPDMRYASHLASRYTKVPFYLSVGNEHPPGRERNVERLDMIATLLIRLADIERNIVRYPLLSNATILPQLHVLMHGNEERR